MKKIPWIFILLLLFINSFAQSDKIQSALSGKKTGKILLQKGINSAWDVQFNYNVSDSAGLSQAGVETDGQYIYTTKWNDDTVCKFDILGNYIGKFTIAGVSQIKDLAYDGTYFYGGNGSDIIYVMDFTNDTLIDSIISPYVTIRHIAYDPVHDAFWTGSWGAGTSDIALIDRQGNVLDTIPESSHGLTGIYGSAFDTVTAGGPYLWVFDQEGNNCNIVQINIATKKPTGLSHDATTDVADVLNPLAGGLFIYPDIIPGTVTLGGLYQGDDDNGVFGYDLASVSQANDIGVISLLSPVSSCELTDSEFVSAAVKNYGPDTITDFCISYISGSDTITDSIQTSILPYSTYTYTFDSTVNFSTPGIYDITVFTSMTNDVYNDNDTLISSIAHISPSPVPYTTGFESGENPEGWKILDANNDSYTWDTTSNGTGANNGTGFAYYSYNPDNNAEDWLFSTCISLTSGTDYNVSFYYKVRDSINTEKFGLFLLETQDTIITDTISDMGEINNETYLQSATQFTVPVSGTYYFGWKAYSDENEWNLYIDDITIEEANYIPDRFSNENIRIYPNPADEDLNILSIEKIKNIKIYTCTGQLAYNNNYNSCHEKLNTLKYLKSNGIYYLYIETESTVINRKIIVNHLK